VGWPRYFYALAVVTYGPGLNVIAQRPCVHFVIQILLEPMALPPLISALHARGFKIAVETNGTLKAPNGLDWICVSPKANAPLVLTQGDELKLVYPQSENKPEDFEDMDFKIFSLQPLDSRFQNQPLSGMSDRPSAPVMDYAHVQACIQYCLDHPKWRFSLQTHKILGID